MRCGPILSAVILLGLAACAGRPEHRIEQLGTPGPETLKRLAAAERAYREDSAEYPALRDELGKDPVAAGWLTRLFVRDVFLAREGGRELGSDVALLRAAASIEDPVERRAIQEIVILGPAAVPVLVGDLLQHPQSQTREIGIELLRYVGPASLPRVLEVSRSSTPVHRRAAARVLAAFPDDPRAAARLRALIDDPEFTVRADAVRGLRNATGDAADLLAEILQHDDDPFVRRVAAQTLVGHPGRRTALLLVDYLAECKTGGDARGYEAAQQSLQELAGARSPRTVDAWRRWAEKQPPQTP